MENGWEGSQVHCLFVLLRLGSKAEPGQVRGPVGTGMAMSDLRLLGSCGRNGLQVLGPCQEGSFEQGVHGSAALLKEAFGVG